MNHVVLIGFMGSGKTRVGKRLSKDLGLPFTDMEKIIISKTKQAPPTKGSACF